MKFITLLALTALTTAALPQASAEEKTESNTTKTETSSGTTTSNTGTESTSNQASAEKINDAQIAAIVSTANKVDVEAGKIAKSKSKNKQVKDFAQSMIKEHENNNRQASALLKKLNLKPEENPTSQTLMDGGKANMANLKNLSGAEFDKAYVNHEVAYHQQVLDAMDKTLIPNAQNSQLKSLLEKTRPVIESHLGHAKNLQTIMEKKGSTS